MRQFNKLEMIGPNVKKFRLQLNLSQAQLADMAGISFSTLAKIEASYNTNPAIETLLNIAEELDVGVDDLLALYHERKMLY